MTEENCISSDDTVQTRFESTSYARAITSSLVRRQQILNSVLPHFAAQPDTLVQIALRLVETMRTQHKVLVAGNGGSAAEAEHFAAELVGRFERNRGPYAALSLTANTSILTAIANDYGYQDIFSRQILALCQPGDLLIVLSTSGESENLICAATAARERLATVIVLTGNQPNRLERLADVVVHVPIADTPIIQEIHTIIIHILCTIVETMLVISEAETPHEKSGCSLDEDISI